MMSMASMTSSLHHDVEGHDGNYDAVSTDWDVEDGISIPTPISGASSEIQVGGEGSDDDALELDLEDGFDVSDGDYFDGITGE